MIAFSSKTVLFERISGLNEFSNKIFHEGSKINIVDFVVSDRLLFSSMKYELKNEDVLFHMPHKVGEKITNHFKIVSPLRKEINRN